MQTNIYLVRHAHSTYTPDELGRPLSQKGFSDAEKVTKSLKEENIDIVISSPYNRAIQTVEGVARQINKVIIIDEDFKERILAGESVEDFQNAITQVWENPSFSWEGGESNHTAQKRGVQALNRVLEKHEGKNIVIGTHGNLMVLIMNYFNKNYDYDFWKALQMPDIYKLTFHKKKLGNIIRREI
ncbi:histidine phosphatase family protein [Oceanobacillus sp. CAU 1775]